MDVPCVPIAKWDKELRDSGFSGTDIATLDDDSPYYIFAHIISTALAPPVEPLAVTFLYDKVKHEFGCNLADKFRQEGIVVHWVKLGDAQKDVKGRDVISTVDLESPYLDEISEQDYKTFMKYLSDLKGGVLWLTRPAQIGCTDPRYGVGIGLFRTIRIELGLDFWTAELQTLDLAAVTTTAVLCQKFLRRVPMDHSLDAEYSIYNGIVRVGRYHWTSTSSGDEGTVTS